MVVTMIAIGTANLIRAAGIMLARAKGTGSSLENELDELMAVLKDLIEGSIPEGLAARREIINLELRIIQEGLQTILASEEGKVLLRHKAWKTSVRRLSNQFKGGDDGEENFGEESGEGA